MEEKIKYSAKNKSIESEVMADSAAI